MGRKEIKIEPIPIGFEELVEKTAGTKVVSPKKKKKQIKQEAEKDSGAIV